MRIDTLPFFFVTESLPENISEGCVVILRLLYTYGGNRYCVLQMRFFYCGELFNTVAELWISSVLRSSFRRFVSSVADSHT